MRKWYHDPINVLGCAFWCWFIYKIVRYYHLGY